ncbi:MAG: DNA_ligase_IV_Ku-like, partial [uncultured Nocardioidaceae bacterium]
GRDCRHASDARHAGDLGPYRRGVGARGQVGRDAGAGGGARRPAHAHLSQRERRNGVIPGPPGVGRPLGARRSRRRPRRGDRGLPRRPAGLRCARRPDARRPGPQGPDCRRPQPGDADGLRPAVVRRPRRHDPAALRPAPAARAARARVAAVAGAADVRRRRRPPGGDAHGGSRGDRQQEAELLLPPGPAHRGVAEVSAPAGWVVRRRWVAARDRLDRAARGAARRGADERGAGLPRPGRERGDRRGGAAAPRAPRPAGHRRAALRDHGPARGRTGDDVGATGGGRGHRVARADAAGPAAPAAGVRRAADRPHSRGPARRGRRGWL